MYLPSLFLGISLAFFGAFVGCLIVVLNRPSEITQFWAIVGTVVTLACALGAGVSALIGFREDS
ncbi:MAG: hypothetical protein U0556_02730 [Dehalococcoidia bacterium]